MPVVREALEKLLTSDDFRVFESDVAEQAGTKVVEMELWRDMHNAIGDLSAADIQPREVGEYLAANRDAAAKFILEVLARPDQHPDGEYPDSEEADEDKQDRQNELMGLGRGFSITFAIYALLIGAPGSDKLSPYLQNRRIPFAKKEAKNIRVVFARTHPDGVQGLRSRNETG